VLTKAVTAGKVSSRKNHAASNEPVCNPEEWFRINALEMAPSKKPANIPEHAAKLQLVFTILCLPEVCQNAVSCDIV
jgi:hypothetical protein